VSLRKSLNKFLYGTHYCIKKINPALNNPLNLNNNINIEHFLAKELLESSNFFFIQIGANDGIRADESYHFITKNNLQGIVVEPLKDMFAQLNKNYSEHPQIKKVNKAIHSTQKTMTLYRISSDANVPDWCHGIASFDKNHLLSGKKKIPDIEKYIIEESVDCISLEELFTDNNSDNISFLQIDTEGYDFEIIKMIDFKKHKPKIIRYECSTLSKSDNQACIDLLFNNGYQFFDEGNDIIAILKK
jgi:FkbM family methyltransferase